MLWVLIRSTPPSTHNICFCGEIKNFNAFEMKKASHQEPCEQQEMRKSAHKTLLLSIYNVLTLKIRSRSPKSNHFFPPS